MAVVPHTTVSAVEVLPEDAHNARLLAQAHPRDWCNPVPRNPYNLVVIGAGPAGLIAAERAFLPGTAPAVIDVLQGGERHTERLAAVDQYALEADHFARSVRQGRLLPPAEDGRAQTAALEALYRSAETGQAVRLTAIRRTG
jgi:predicted dehydrogenase